MTKPLPKVAITVTIAVCAVLAIGAVLTFGSGDPPAKSRLASPYTKVGQAPTGPGAGINSLTGEPLSETAKGYELQSQQIHSGKAPTGHP